MSGPEVVELANFLADKTSAAALADCKKLTETLRKTSCLIVKDPRVNEQDNSTFLSMMERYYDQPREVKMKDVHPELSYQLGATPDFVELPRDHLDKIKNLAPENSAHVPQGADLKWRYFWRIGERPQNTDYPELNSAPVIPDEFPEWPSVMNQWGGLMLGTIHTVCEMLALGLDLPLTALTDLLQHGPHLLAPTGSDVGNFHQLGQIFAGFHYDLNFLTIHGKSRFPGLYIWLRDGTRVLVRVPDGCLLIQAGKQIEWLTAGDITAGFHEVVVTPETLQALEKAKSEGRSQWRVSSTLFAHVASDKHLQPLGKFNTASALEQYPKIVAGEQVNEELKLIKLNTTGK